MLFNSYQFFLFFPIVTIIYFLLPHKFRWFHLLAASCYFYMAFVPIYIFILFFTIIIDYIAGIMIEKATGARRKWFLVMSVVANVGILGFFKYYNFFVGNVNFLFHSFNSANSIPFLKMILPIGLSFHTFQAMSYTIEVYRGNQKAERHFGIYSLYVMFYPQLVAGPIERPQNVLHQFHEEHTFNYDDVVNGLRQILWGLFKKSVIADRISLLVNPILNHPRDYSPLSILLAVILFAYQIYCDFSGYSDIALGAARVMGIKLMVNFDRPYAAKSISEFWKKWHISLSTWFYDYLFNPLVTPLRNWGVKAIIFGLILTFLTSGLWHGAAWHYVVWGGLHGLALTYEALTRKSRKKFFKKMPLWLNNSISVFCTFSYVCVGYIFFRANNLSDAVYILKQIPSSFAELFAGIMHHQLITRKFLANVPFIPLCASIFWVVVLEVIQSAMNKKSIEEYLMELPGAGRYSLYAFMALCILIFGVFSNQQFIYFQF